MASEVDVTERLVSHWLLNEMIAEGLLDSEGYFQGATNRYVVDVKAFRVSND